MFFNCPWCDHEHDAYRMFGQEAGVHRIHCDKCSKPVVVSVRVAVNANVELEKSMEAERRMKEVVWDSRS